MGKELKQNQVIAIVNGKKSQVEKVFTKIYQKLDKTDLFKGVDRTYRPKADDGDQRPPERKIVQQSVKQAIDEVVEVNKDMINLIATMDIGNCHCVADIMIGDEVLVGDVPATHLIFLEKQMINFTAFISKLPVLDAAEEWSWSSNVGCYVAKERETSSTAKVLNHKTVAKATKEHPEQVVQYTIDEIVGYWTTVAMSGNIMADEKTALLKRVRVLSDAIKKAREEANSEKVRESNIGDKILYHIFGK